MTVQNSEAVAYMFGIYLNNEEARVSVWSEERRVEDEVRERIELGFIGSHKLL